ncbi:MAG: amidohydrolase family protein [Saprospiraceae bacterium]|nr:amidohydrolase family protein [Saprospiraceae bacterium]
MYKTLFRLLSVMILPGFMFGQIDYDKVKEATDVLFLNDVYVHNSGDTTFTMQDIIIQDGIIKQMGGSLEAPYNARTLKVDSSYVYPSFIDMMSHLGVKKEERKEDPRVKFPGFPPNDVAGITPEWKLTGKYDTKDGGIKSYRAAGFGMAHIVPRGRMLPGQSSLISLKSEDMVLDEGVATYMQFTGARRMYPSTVIAIMAKWRDLFNNAAYLSEHQDIFNKSPLGTPRPKKDLMLESLIPVTKKEQAVFTRTESIKSVFRALELEAELDYQLVLANAEVVDDAIAKIKAQNVPVVLSLALPKAEKEKDKKGDKAEKKDNKDKAVEHPQKEELAQRKRESIERYESQAGLLEDAGHKFAFSTMDLKSKDFKSNLNRMINAGLSKAGALDALTINAAKLLEIDDVAGSVEQGKLAYLFVSNKPYFNEGAHIGHTIVDGNWLEHPKKEKKKAKAGTGSGISGEWSYEIAIPEDERSGTITIEKADDDYSVTVFDQNQTDTEFTGNDVSYNGSTLTFTITIEDGGTLIVNFTMNFEGDSYEGFISIDGLGEFPMQGQRITSPE